MPMTNMGTTNNTRSNRVSGRNASIGQFGRRPRRGNGATTCWARLMRSCQSSSASSNFVEGVDVVANVGWRTDYDHLRDDLGLIVV